MRILLTGCAAAAVLLLSSTPSVAAGNDSPASTRMTWVVRTDQQGRLVRRLVPATSQVAMPAIVAAKEPGKPVAVRTVPKEVKEIVEIAADKYELDPLLVHSVISVESNYNPLAQSPKGAQGLMQLIPSTAKRFGAQNSFDPRENIEAGVRYLKHLKSLYNDDLNLTLAAYNAGEGAVAKYNNSIPPYAETLDYVRKVGQHYEAAKRSKPATTAAAPPPAAAAPVVEEFRHIEQGIDDQGRVYVHTR